MMDKSMVRLSSIIRKVQSLWLVHLLLLIILSNGCLSRTSKESDDKNDPIRAYVSILPQKYFVERVGGDLVQVQVMVKPGASPATYEPTMKQIADLGNTNVFFRIGVPFEEAWIGKIKEANKNMRLIDTRDGITLREIDAFNDHGHQHDAEEVHDHKGKDPHIWLSPELVKQQAKTIAEALGEIRPGQKEFFNQNLNDFILDLDRLNDEIQKAFEGLENKMFVVFHPSWGYFADDFGLQQIPIESEGKEPGFNQMSKLINFAKDHNIKVIFVQKQFNKKQAGAVAGQINGVVVEIDPLAENYIENLKHIAGEIAIHLQNQ